MLVQRGMAPTRSAAQRLIERGAVRWQDTSGWRVVGKAGEALGADCAVEITDDAELRFVSRGGLKLAAALDRCRIDVEDRLALDVGQSTGGFTDVLLQRGVARVVGIDVGRGQLAPAIAADPRVVAVEGLNARDVTGSTFERETPEHSFDLVVADVSFISLTLILPTIARYLSTAGDALLLVKPQFELQPADIGKGGLVRDPAAHVRVEHRIREACDGLGLAVHDWFESAITGGDGNREFFVRARPSGGTQQQTEAP